MRGDNVYGVINITTADAEIFPTLDEAITYLKVVRSRGYTAFLMKIIDLNEELKLMEH